MVHITNRRWLVQPLHLVVLTSFPDNTILQETLRNLDPENIVKGNFNYEVSSYSA